MSSSKYVIKDPNVSFPIDGVKVNAKDLSDDQISSLLNSDPGLYRFFESKNVEKGKAPKSVSSSSTRSVAKKAEDSNKESEEKENSSSIKRS